MNLPFQFPKDDIFLDIQFVYYYDLDLIILIKQNNEGNK